MEMIISKEQYEAIFDNINSYWEAMSDLLPEKEQSPFINVEVHEEDIEAIVFIPHPNKDYILYISIIDLTTLPENQPVWLAAEFANNIGLVTSTYHEDGEEVVKFTIKDWAAGTKERNIELISKLKSFYLEHFIKDTLTPEQIEEFNNLVSK